MKKKEFQWVKGHIKPEKEGIYYCQIESPFNGLIFHQSVLFENNTWQTVSQVKHYLLSEEKLNLKEKLPFSQR